MDRTLGRLEESKTHLGRLVQEAEEYAICQLDPEERITSWTPQATRITGWTAEEVLGRPVGDCYPEVDSHPGLPEQDLEQARNQGSHHRESWRIRKDGSRFLGSRLILAHHDNEGRVTGYTQIVQDITRRREEESRLQSLARSLEAQMAVRTAELQVTEARLHSFLRHVPAAIAFKDLDGQLLLANRRAEALIGLSAATTPARKLQETFPPEVVERALAEDRRVLDRGDEVRIEEPVRLPDGTAREYLVHKFPLHDADGQCWGLGVIATDITERKRAESVQLQRQKLESLGLLAGGIAHDFNNLLGAMLGSLETTRFALESRGAPAGELNLLEELITRASSLVSQVLAYSGKGKTQVQTVDLNRQVQEVLRILQSFLARRAAVRWEPGAGLPGLEGDPGQVNQVVMNLLINAAEALGSEGGTIAVRTRSEQVSPEAAASSFPNQDLDPGAYQVLEVADTGCGMPPEVLPQIFEPFFSTKLAGRGLGLSAVQGIVRGHRGGIQVLTGKGRGTTFRILFPAVAARGQGSAPPRPAPDETPAFRGSGAVLLVEDDTPMRQAAASYLRRMGFDVLEAGDGVEALQRFQAHRRSIVLVLMDLAMPRMNGEEAYRHLRRMGAMAPIILTSGFGREETLRQFRGKGLAGFLPKPYPFKVLAAMVEQVLGDREGPSDLLPAALAWMPEFNTGFPPIDDQHRGLVDSYNRVLEAVGAPGANGKDPARALSDLAAAVAAHFEFEEGLMGKTAFPGTQDHRKAHQQLCRQVQALARNIRRGEAALTPPVLLFLEDWLVCHIQYEDLELARHLKG
jgi:hemerythrin-like metal-binding protein/PAS domain S-box-containing protein